jgi:opacity protein-like surface antigen
MRRIVLAAVCAVALSPAAASADVLAPPKGKVYTGVSGKKSVTSFKREVGAHPSVFGFFTWWKGSVEWIYDSVERSGSRLMLHISTQDGYGTPEAWTPREISRGLGDSYLVNTNQRIAEHGQPTYVRLMAEMNQANNGYCAYNHDGSSRGPSHSTAAFKEAWRRATLILRGGPVAEIDAKLRALGMPPVQKGPAELPRPTIAMMWVPQVAGTPDIRANSARAYWPGGEYVDWVGTDFYSRFPNFHWLDDFYRDFPGKPFVFGEWALWGADDPGFVTRLFAWIGDRPRVRMVVYNQGKLTDGPFRLRHYPRSKAALRKALAHRRFAPDPGGR